LLEPLELRELLPLLLLLDPWLDEPEPLLLCLLLPLEPLLLLLLSLLLLVAMITGIMAWMTMIPCQPMALLPGWNRVCG
jgi:hypothetical protein